MIGSQVHINRAILFHEKNPVKEDIGGVKREDIIEAINYEYWKQWRKLLITSEYPVIKCSKLGYFEMPYLKGKKLIWDLLKKIRWNQERFPEKLPNDGTMMGQIQGAHIKALGIVWKQIDKLRHKHIKQIKQMNEDFIKKGTPEKIKKRYE